MTALFAYIAPAAGMLGASRRSRRDTSDHYRPIQSPIPIGNHQPGQTRFRLRPSQTAGYIGMDIFPASMSSTTSIDFPTGAAVGSTPPLYAGVFAKFSGPGAIAQIPAMPLFVAAGFSLVGLGLFLAGLRRMPKGASAASPP